jgi:hypothetical protein
MPKVNKSQDTDHIDRTILTSSSVTTTTTIELPENSRIVQPSYLEKNTGKVRKLILVFIETIRFTMICFRRAKSHSSYSQYR